MDPATLAMAVAPLVARAAEHFGGALWDQLSGDVNNSDSASSDDAGWQLLGRIAMRINQWFGAKGNDVGTRALSVVAAAPDSQKAVDRLAEVLKDGLADDQDFGKELYEMVQSAESKPGAVGQFVLQASGHARIGKVLQIHTVNTETFNA